MKRYTYFRGNLRPEKLPHSCETRKFSGPKDVTPYGRENRNSQVIFSEELFSIEPSREQQPLLAYFILDAIKIIIATHFGNKPISQKYEPSKDSIRSSK